MPFIAPDTRQTFDANREVIDNVFEPGDSEDVTSSGASAQSTVLSDTFSTGGSCLVVEIVADGDLRYALGSNPTATATDARLPDGAGKIIRVQTDHKIAVISESGTAKLNIVHQK